MTAASASAGTVVRSSHNGTLIGDFSGDRIRRAIIDIGSNTVRLVLYGGSARAPVVLFNEKVTARLGRDVGTTGLLADEAVALAMRGLERYALLLAGLDVPQVDVVATAAVREAANGPAFLDAVTALGFAPRLLSGEDEARTSASGVLGAFPGAEGIVGDLGGGSLELVEIGSGTCGTGVSLPLGTLRLGELLEEDGGGGKKTGRKRLAKIIAKGANGMAEGQTLYLVGGTLRAMAVYAMHANNYPLTDPHGFCIPGSDATAFTDEIAACDDETLRAIPRISTMRAQKLPLAAQLLGALVDRLKPNRIVFSSWGLREGLHFSQLPQSVQRSDPLLAGVGTFAETRGCPPLLATRMAAWTARVTPPGEYGSERLRLAATMLSLSAMQVEPNMRIPFGIEWALHKRWLSVSPEERAMLAATVSANGNRCSLPDELHALADGDALETAICWGLAIRLGRRLGARARGVFAVSSLMREGAALVLSIEEDSAALYGLSNEKDLNLLADRLGLEPEVRVVDTLADAGDT